MANYKLLPDGIIQDPVKKKPRDLYKVTVDRDELTIVIPMIEEMVTALNEARDYKTKTEELRKKLELVRPTLHRIRGFLVVLDELLPKDIRFTSSNGKAVIHGLVNEIDLILRG